MTIVSPAWTRHFATCSAARDRAEDRRDRQMLSVSGSPPWRTVAGGSRCYVLRAASWLHAIRVSAPVCAVRRYPDGVEVRDASGEVLL